MVDTKSNKNARLKLRLKIFKDRKKILDTTRSRKGSIQYLIKNTNGDWYEIKVTYERGRTVSSPNKVIANERRYSTKGECLRALSIFTSKSEVDDYLKNYVVG